MARFLCLLHRTLLKRSAPPHKGLLSLEKRQIATSTGQAVAKPQVKSQPSGSGAGYVRRYWYRSPPYKIVQAYGEAQKKRPYATQIGSLVVIYACGDLLAQGFEGEDYDPWRTLRNMIIGCVVALPSYKWCESVLISAERVAHSQAGSSFWERRSITLPSSDHWLQRPFSIR